jgi:AraC family transcriptional regulator
LSARSLARVVEYIDSQLEEPLTLQQIAQVAEISPSYFLSLFKRSTGLAPHQFLIAKRLERARALLTQTTIPIADVAGRTGFADQSHLTRLMRRHTGLTPGMLRNS